MQSGFFVAGGGRSLRASKCFFILYPGYDLGGKKFPVTFRNDLYSIIGHLNGGLIIDGV